MSANSDIPEARNILIKMLHLSSLEIRRYDNDCRREPRLGRCVLALWCGTANRQLEGSRLYLSDLRVPEPAQTWIANTTYGENVVLVWFSEKRKRETDARWERLDQFLSASTAA